MFLYLIHEIFEVVNEVKFLLNILDDPQIILIMGNSVMPALLYMGGGKSSVKINLLGTAPSQLSTAPSKYMLLGTAPSHNYTCSKELRDSMGRAPCRYGVIIHHFPSGYQISYPNIRNWKDSGRGVGRGYIKS